MAQTFTPTAGDGATGVQQDYPLQLVVGLPGQLADLTPASCFTGHNETAARIAYGIPLIANGSGTLDNSATPQIAAGACLGISVRTAVNEKAGPDATVPYQEGVPPNFPVNILRQGCIYLAVFEAVAPGDALRYFKSGANAGKWGKTASAGNSLALTAGQWAIRRGGSATKPLVLEINTPAGLAFTADT